MGTGDDTPVIEMRNKKVGMFRLADTWVRWGGDGMFHGTRREEASVF